MPRVILIFFVPEKRQSRNETNCEKSKFRESATLLDPARTLL